MTEVSIEDYSQKIGDVVEWEGEKWIVDNTDDEFKEENEETSLFLLPIEYKDANKLDQLYRTGHPDSVGFWVSVKYVNFI